MFGMLRHSRLAAGEYINGLAALRSPCSRLQVLCLPSVASPFAGLLSLRAQSKEPKERAPRTSVQGGSYAASARLHGRRR